ncbi:MAG: hypothetical protein FK733_10665 [Asgard group archaeon]|nr:hypothetical protein [Asgard group archaeon]
MLELKKTEEWAFFFLFIGGNLLIVNAIIGMIVYGVDTATDYIMPFLDGAGLFTFLDLPWFYIGAAINILIGLLALFLGLKLFIKPFWNFITKIDLMIIALIMFILGIGSFSLPGYLFVVSAIYCVVYRTTPEGANNPKGK